MFRLTQNNKDPILLPPDLAIVIGRGDGCDAQICDPAMSRVHCRVVAMDGGVTVTDLGSRWGTFVNGEAIEQRDLRPGDRLRIGETVLKLDVDGEPGQTTLRPPGSQARPQDAETIAPGVTPQNERESYAVAGDLEFTSSDGMEAMHLAPSQFLGSTFQRCKVQQTLATTRSGIVFRAKERSHDRPVALKIFHPASSAKTLNSGDFDERRKRCWGYGTRISCSCSTRAGPAGTASPRHSLSMEKMLSI